MRSSEGEGGREREREREREVNVTRKMREIRNRGSEANKKRELIGTWGDRGGKKIGN